jgi:RNA polymerase sigma factor (sigma-70 family)
MGRRQDVAGDVRGGVASARARRWSDVRREQPMSRGGLDHGVAALYAAVTSPSQGAVATETAARLERAFDRLSEDHERVITLARIVGLGHAEIGQEMGREEGAVRILLHRALARLGRLMREV